MRISATPPFGRLRLKLTLWYSGVLAAALLCAGVALHLGSGQLLLQPVEATVAGQAALLRDQWESSAEFACPVAGAPAVMSAEAPAAGQTQAAIALPLYVSCYFPDGALQAGSAGLSWSAVPAMPAEFLSDTLIDTAMRQGQAEDVVMGPPGDPAIYRYALKVAPPGEQQPAGIIQVGRPIGEQQAALNNLRVALLGLGLLTLVGGTAGGIFLSGRALAPARLAFARQQGFVSDASHELRTPLTLLRANAETLLRGRDRLPPEDAALLDDIVTEAAHMAALTDRLLTLARLDAGNAHPEYDLIDLAPFALDLAHRALPLAQQRGVALLSPAGPAVPVLGDRPLLAQVALILLDNAIKYTPPGGRVTIRTYLVDDEARLVVSDTGVGIPAEQLPRLGERFYRVDRARARETGGVGLGLAIARSIAAAHGGTLTLVSAPGQGTTATLALPLAGRGTAWARGPDRPPLLARAPARRAGAPRRLIGKRPDK